MKKEITTISFLFILCSISFPQYQVIYDAGSNRNVLSLVSFSNVFDNNLSVFASLSGDYVTSFAPKWIRYFKNSNQWTDSLHRPFLSGGVCYNGSGGFSWSTLESFIRSPIDTNFMVGKFQWVSCFPPEGGYFTILTYDNGQTVVHKDFGLTGYDLDPKNDSNIYGVGAPYLQQYQLWRSTDKGYNWTTFNLPFNTGGGNYILKVNPFKVNEIYLTKEPILYKSTNSGNSFFAFSSVDGYITSLNFDLIDSSYYYTSSTGIYKSSNSGLNWIQIKSNLNCYSILINRDNHNIVYSGTDSGLYISSNAGQNWSRYFDNFSASSAITGLVKYKNNGDTIYAANNKKVYKIWGQLISINKNSNIIPNKFYLYQNYPNPFNPTTRIKFDIPQTPLAFGKGEGLGVRIIIYDILGREVATLVNEKLQPGTYEVEWNASNYPSGVYYYKLETENYSDTKKLILLK